MIHCPRCDHETENASRFCPNCGENLLEAVTGEADPYVGKKLAGNYLIHNLIGVGAMGRVYRAEQISLGKPVAVKILHRYLLGDPSLERRFQREARAAARLDHPNCISIIDFGKDDDNTLFIVLEYLDGQNLGQMLAESGPVSWQRCVHLLSQVASALDEAHAHGIIHRDLKPENIVVENRRNEQDFVKVLDFGIAKVRESEERDGVLTVNGAVCGTPEFMSPEQARGDEDVDARSDVYAMGCILYQMLTGELPFAGETVLAVVTKVLSEEVVPPRKRVPDVNIPPVFELICLRAMSKEPSKRPSSALTFRKELMAAAAVTAAPGPVAVAIQEPSEDGDGSETLPHMDAIQAIPPDADARLSSEIDDDLMAGPDTMVSPAPVSEDDLLATVDPGRALTVPPTGEAALARPPTGENLAPMEDVTTPGFFSPGLSAPGDGLRDLGDRTQPGLPRAALLDTADSELIRPSHAPAPSKPASAREEPSAQRRAGVHDTDELLTSSLEDALAAPEQVGTGPSDDTADSSGPTARAADHHTQPEEQASASAPGDQLEDEQALPDGGAQTGEGMAPEAPRGAEKPADEHSDGGRSPQASEADPAADEDHSVATGETDRMLSAIDLEESSPAPPSSSSSEGLEPARPSTDAPPEVSQDEGLEVADGETDSAKQEISAPPVHGEGADFDSMASSPALPIHPTPLLAGEVVEDSSIRALSGPRRLGPALAFVLLGALLGLGIWAMQRTQQGGPVPSVAMSTSAQNATASPDPSAAASPKPIPQAPPAAPSHQASAGEEPPPRPQAAPKPPAPAPVKDPAKTRKRRAKADGSESGEAKRLFGQAHELFLDGRCSQAIHPYEEALKRGYRDPEIHYELAGCYSRLSKPAAARRQYEIYLSKRPDSPRRAVVEAILSGTKAR